MKGCGGDVWDGMIGSFHVAGEQGERKKACRAGWKSGFVALMAWIRIDTGPGALTFYTPSLSSHTILQY